MSVPGLDEREIHLYAAIISARERGHRYGDCIQTEYESIIGHLLYKRNDPFFKDQKEVVDTVVALHNKGLIEFNDVLIVRGLDGENKSYETYRNLHYAAKRDRSQDTEEAEGMRPVPVFQLLSHSHGHRLPSIWEPPKLYQELFRHIYLQYAF